MNSRYVHTLNIGVLALSFMYLKLLELSFLVRHTNVYTLYCHYTTLKLLNNLVSSHAWHCSFRKIYVFHHKTPTLPSLYQYHASYTAVSFVFSVFPASPLMSPEPFNFDVLELCLSCVCAACYVMPIRFDWTPSGPCFWIRTTL